MLQYSLLIGDMATWHHWDCCWVLWCGCVPLGPEGWGEGRWGTAGSGGRRGDFESCVVKKQTEELCLWVWQTPCMGWECVRVWLDEGQIHTLTKWWGKWPAAHSFIHMRFYLHKTDYRAKVTASKGNKPCRNEFKTATSSLTWNLQRLG